jgi:HPt (histidine-containing phosphotransfer) domain-containing protein
MFAADMPARIAELDQGLAEGNSAKFHRAAHSIKGSAANLGATRLRTLAENLEHCLRASGLGAVGPLVAEVKLEAVRAQQALEEILASPPS